MLIKHGAELSGKNRNGMNVLHVAAQGDQPVSIGYFIEKGLDVDSLDKEGRTPMHHAAMFGCELSVCYLVSYHGFINAKDNQKQTPLHLAIKSYKENPNIDCIKKLLLNGADREIRNFIDRTPLDELNQLTVNESKCNKDLEDDCADIRRILTEKYGFLHCLMIRNHYSKPK